MTLSFLRESDTLVSRSPKNDINDEGISISKEDIMKIREEKWSNCKCCGKRDVLLQSDSYGCDSCEKPIDDLLDSDNTKYHDHLELSVWGNGRDGSERLQFCSWKCLFKKLKTIKTDDFISLPYLCYDQTIKGQTVKDFWKAIRDFK